MSYRIRTITEFKSCMYRKYWFDEEGGYADCILTNKECTCIFPPSSIEKARECGCKENCIIINDGTYEIKEF